MPRFHTIETVFVGALGVLVVFHAIRIAAGLAVTSDNRFLQTAGKVGGALVSFPAQ